MNKLITILIVFLVVSSLGVTAFFLLRSEPNKITPTTIQTEPKSTETDTLKAKQALINSLPVDTGDYFIQYYSQTDSFEVAIQHKPIDQNVDRALTYFKSKGFDNICTLSVHWTTPKELWGEDIKTNLPDCSN